MEMIFPYLKSIPKWCALWTFSKVPPDVLVRFSKSTPRSKDNSEWNNIVSFFRKINKYWRRKLKKKKISFFSAHQINFIFRHIKIQYFVITNIQKFFRISTWFLKYSSSKTTHKIHKISCYFQKRRRFDIDIVYFIA